jgi:predicted O-methyltransferase YrrM
MSEQPPSLASHIAAMADLGARLTGHLTAREVRFLALLGAAPTCRGEVLEIGSFKGKSTVILAKSAAFAGLSRVCAVDPLDLPSVTDPGESERFTIAPAFRAALRDNGVEALVEFHQMTSGALGRTWDRPIRLLWIDGDHTYQGAMSDFTVFAPHLACGAIVAFHDVLNWFIGPPKAMVDGPLASPLFGACGVIGSIGWAQYLGDRALAAPFDAMRRRLVHRARVPHAEVPPAQWLAGVSRFDA